MTKNKKKFQMPHIFLILYTIILIFAILSYIIPAGEYCDIQKIIDATKIYAMISLEFN